MSDKMKVLAFTPSSWEYEGQIITFQEVLAETPPSDEEIAAWLDCYSQGVRDSRSMLVILEDVYEAANNLRLKILSIEIYAAILDGLTLSKAISEFLWLDLKIESFLVDVGEETGQLDVLLAHAARLRRGDYAVSDQCPHVGREYLRVFFCLAILQDSGLPISRSLKILCRNFEATGVERDNEIASELNHVCEKIENGLTLSEAMAEVGTFGDPVVAAISVGERLDNLEVVLKSWFSLS